MRLPQLGPLHAFAVIAVVAGTPGLGCAETQPSRRGTYRPRDHQFLSVEHVNQMGSSFELVGLRVLVDGRDAFAREGDQPLPSRLCVSRETAAPGAHEIRVMARYRGHGSGIFSYLSGYRFTATAETRVEIPPDAYGLAVQSTGYEGGGPTAPLEDRPQIRFAVTPELANPGGGCGAQGR